MPNATLFFQIAKALGADAAILLSTAKISDETPNVLLVDDESIVLARNETANHRKIAKVVREHFG